MAKNDTKVRGIARDKKGAFVSKETSRRGAERWAIRASDGRIEVVTTKPSSAASMDRAVKRYSRALKDLAKR